jgi:hypothetical protein
MGEVTNMMTGEKTLYDNIFRTMYARNELRILLLMAHVACLFIAEGRTLCLMSKQEFIIITLGFLALFGVTYYFTQCDGAGCGAGHQRVVAQDFDACAQAGNPVMESYPRRCAWPSGVVVTEVIDEQDVPPLVETSPQPSNLQVAEPAPSAAVGLPLRIRGTAQVYDDRVHYRLLDADGSVLTEGQTKIDELGDFDVSVMYADPFGTSGKLEVFESSPNGDATDAFVSLPVQFLKVKTRNVVIHFMDLGADPDRANCSMTKAFKRRVPEDSVAERDALDALLVGPTEQERLLHGAQTSLPEGAAVRSFTVRSGEAVVDFEQGSFKGVAGTCRVQAARAQIEKTLRQFPEITSVTILENGAAARALQP